jgi:hypothetical protein
MTNSNSFLYQGQTIHRQSETGLICLTDLWQVQGSIFEKTPLDWVRLKTTQKLLKGLVEPNETVVVWSESEAKVQSSTNEPLIAEVPGVLEVTQEGDELRTYATEELAVVYARFISVECYEWALENLVEGDQQEADYLESVETRTKARRQKEFSRRALIAAGWAVPVVLSVGLNNKAVALPLSGHVDTGHGDFHDDTGHIDNSHNDHVDHRDTHQDTGGPVHEDQGTGTDPHQDGSLHVDHGDGSTHRDISQHTDAGHQDHTDSTHQDGSLHVDHGDGSTHRDISQHTDAGYSDHNDNATGGGVTHSDHGDGLTHGDQTIHTDYGYVDHTDIQHGDYQDSAPHFDIPDIHIDNLNPHNDIHNDILNPHIDIHNDIAIP